MSKAFVSAFFRFELHAATKEEAAARWLGGAGGKWFRCCLCGAKLKEGDRFLVLFTNDMKGAGGNPILCEACVLAHAHDKEKLREAWRQHCAAACSEKFWWFHRHE